MSFISAQPHGLILLDTESKTEIEIMISSARFRLEAKDYQVITNDIELLDAINTSRSQLVQIWLEGFRAYPRVRRIWEALQYEYDLPLSLRLRFWGSGETSLNDWMIDVGDTSALELQCRLASFLGFSGRRGVVLTGTTPLFWPDGLDMLILTRTPADSFLKELDSLPSHRNLQVVFLRRADQDLLRIIPPRFWKRLFSDSIPHVLELDARSDTRPLRLFIEDRSTTLLVFPERMLPLRRAYFMRAFDLLLGLVYSRHPPALMVLGPDSDELVSIRRALEIFSPSVRVFPLVRGNLPWAHQIVLLAERGLREIHGIRGKAPLRYSERGEIFATAQITELLAGVVDSLPNLKNVIYTGAWFGRAVRSVAACRPNLRWICDTHDLFFGLERSQLSDADVRYFFSAACEQRKEIADLKLATVVVLISEADRLLLEQEGFDHPVIVESGSFSHIELIKGGEDRSNFFGFIGSNNRNNQKCLTLIMRSWWPQILMRWPNARLRVAGDICRSQEAQRLSQVFPSSVDLLFFVDSLTDYYSSVGVMLSPIVIRGGLNFKSVEALMAGCQLFTTPLGLRCLGLGLIGVSEVSDSGVEVKEINLVNEFEERQAIHRSARHRFGDETAYTGLIRILSSSSLPISRSL